MFVWFFYFVKVNLATHTNNTELNEFSIFLNESENIFPTYAQRVALGIILVLSFERQQY